MVGALQVPQTESQAPDSRCVACESESGDKRQDSDEMNSIRPYGAIDSVAAAAVRL